MWRAPSRTTLKGGARGARRCLAEDLERNHSADEEEAEGDDVDEGCGSVVREIQVDGEDRGDDGQGPGVANPAWTFEEVKDAGVEEDERGEQEAVGDSDGEEVWNGAGED